MGGYLGLLRSYLWLSGRFWGVFVRGCVVAVRTPPSPFAQRKLLCDNDLGYGQMELGENLWFLSVFLCARGRHAPCGREQVNS